MATIRAVLRKDKKDTKGRCPVHLRFEAGNQAANSLRSGIANIGRSRYLRLIQPFNEGRVMRSIHQICKITVTLSLVIFFGLASEAHAQSPVHGAWEVTSRSGVNTDGAWKAENIQPSVYLFLDSHYSVTYVNGEKPRPLMADNASRASITEEEVRSMFFPFTSNAGVYEIAGNEITMDPTVALWPNFMESGTATYNFAVSGNTLTLTASNDAGLSMEIVLKRTE